LLRHSRAASMTAFSALFMLLLFFFHSPLSLITDSTIASIAFGGITSSLLDVPPYAASNDCPYMAAIN
jgi:hypothetical protein